MAVLTLLSLCDVWGEEVLKLWHPSWCFVTPWWSRVSHLWNTRRAEVRTFIEASGSSPSSHKLRRLHRLLLRDPFNQSTNETYLLSVTETCVQRIPRYVNDNARGCDRLDAPADALKSARGVFTPIIALKYCRLKNACLTMRVRWMDQWRA